MKEYLSITYQKCMKPRINHLLEVLYDRCM
jgi:hypothetical protein